MQWIARGSRPVFNVLHHGAAKVDDKGRIFLPNDVRAEADAWWLAHPEYDRRLVIAAGGASLWLMFPDHFYRLRDQLQVGKMEMTREWIDAGHVLAMATPVKVDDLGRVQIPADFREQGGIERDAVLHVVQGRIELWDKKRWTLRRQVATHRLFGRDEEVL